MSATIHDLLGELRANALDERDKGDKFERLIRAYLLGDPEWTARFSDVWLWTDWRLGRVTVQCHNWVVAQIGCAADTAVVFHYPNTMKDGDPLGGARPSRPMSRGHRWLSRTDEREGGPLNR